MPGREAYDAVVVDSGPNDLAAAVELALTCQSVAVLEAQETAGGGARSAEPTLPGFVHDLGSAIHPLGYASPYFKTLPLEEHRLEWVHPRPTCPSLRRWRSPSPALSSSTSPPVRC